MEWKIGEIKQVNGEWYQCIKEPEDFICEICRICAFRGTENCDIDECSGSFRSDKQDVIFKKLEKVGGPFTCRNMFLGRNAVILQRYKLFIEPILTDDSILNAYDTKNKTILIALNNKEDMKEEKHSNFENIGKNLKPFDLEAAKAGKPVCTRDGRKARIICFDLNNDEYPIVVAITNNGEENEIHKYSIDGKICTISTIKEADLMMLLEKKEGYAKIRKDINLYDTKEEADRKMIGNDEYVTAKVEWEE